MTKLTPEEIFEKMLDGFSDRSGCSEVSYVHQVIEDAEHNARYDGGITDEQLDVLDSTLSELIDVAESARKYLQELREL